MDPSQIWLAEAVVIDDNGAVAREAEPASYMAAGTSVAQPTAQPVQVSGPPWPLPVAALMFQFACGTGRGTSDGDGTSSRGKCTFVLESLSSTVA